MTALPEAKLSREAEICYTTIAGVTDYDCWEEGTEPTPIDVIIETLRQNTQKIREIIKLAVSRMPDRRRCDCATALKTAIVTDPDFISAGQKKKLGLLIGKYLTEGEH
jgi:5'-methylthioadenosine phosphorylase